MLRHLSIRDIVLIDRLELDFDSGLGVLTGETGAGKSILLDSLGLALGTRADTGLIRPGAEQAIVAATFDVASGHPVNDLLSEHGLELDEGSLLLRRIVGRDGRSRAFVNDQPATAGLLRQIGELLVEIQGQFERFALAVPAADFRRTAPAPSPDPHPTIRNGRARVQVAEARDLTQQGVVSRSQHLWTF